VRTLEAGGRHRIAIHAGSSRHWQVSRCLSPPRILDIGVKPGADPPGSTTRSQITCALPPSVRFDSGLLSPNSNPVRNFIPGSSMDSLYCHDHGCLQDGRKHRARSCRPCEPAPDLPSDYPRVRAGQSGARKASSSGTMQTQTRYHYASRCGRSAPKALTYRACENVGPAVGTPLRGDDARTRDPTDLRFDFRAEPVDAKHGRRSPPSPWSRGTSTRFRAPRSQRARTPPTDEGDDVAEQSSRSQPGSAVSSVVPSASVTGRTVREENRPWRRWRPDDPMALHPPAAYDRLCLRCAGPAASRGPASAHRARPSPYRTGPVRAR
jgi:hypothetical protein